MESIHISKLKLKTHHPERIMWRRSYLAEVKSGELVGKRFKTTRGKIFICEKITKDYVYFFNIEMERRFALFELPYEEPIPYKEQIEEFISRPEIQSLKIGKGCQLHGDQDAIVTYKNGRQYLVAWNY